MNTALDVGRTADLETRILEHMTQEFLMRYKPEDRYHAVEFERDLHMLVRQIYRDAQEPLLAHLTRLAASAPAPTYPIYIKSDSNRGNEVMPGEPPG